MGEHDVWSSDDSPRAGNPYVRPASRLVKAVRFAAERVLDGRDYLINLAQTSAVQCAKREIFAFDYLPTSTNQSAQLVL